jgi:hypothetical protein
VLIDIITEKKPPIPILCNHRGHHYKDHIPILAMSAKKRRKKKKREREGKKCRVKMTERMDERKRI